MYVTNFIELTEVWYKPDYGKNRELSEDECFRVLLQPLTYHEIRKIEELHTSVSNTTGKSEARTDYEAVMCAMLRKSVKKIENAVIRFPNTGEQKAIDNIEDLIKYDKGAVLTDIFMSLRDHSKLNEGIKKNSNTPLDTLNVPIKRLRDGGVHGVIERLSEDTKEAFNTTIQNSDLQTMKNDESEIAMVSSMTPTSNGTQA